MWASTATAHGTDTACRAKMLSSGCCSCRGAGPDTPHGVPTFTSTVSKTSPRAAHGAQNPPQRDTRLERDGLNLHEGAAAPGGTHGKALPTAAAAPVCRGIARYAVCSSEDPYSRSQNSMKFNFTPI